ncbi:hypothetical protein [Streptomyces sp. NPDC050121]|uniref:hypothetical protein n=1 Tax=Streptomyces sp. NPDC050121 TaxID=3365601 RepID=UPI0037AF3AAB
MRRLLGSARLLTLTGTGGVGKTRLALEAAAAVRKSFPDGTWLVDLAPVRDPSAVATTAAAAVGFADLGDRPALDRLAERLAERRVLIVLDNCEILHRRPRLLAQGDDVVPIPGTRNADRLAENTAAVDVELTDADREQIRQILPQGSAGSRYPAAMLATMSTD